MRDQFKDIISASEIAGLVRRLRRANVMLPIDMVAAPVLQLDHSIGKKRRINTIIRNTDGRNWTITILNFDCTKENLRSCQRKPGQKAVLERASTGSKLGYHMYGDFDLFTKAMTLCKTYGYLEEGNT